MTQNELQLLKDFISEWWYGMPEKMKQELIELHEKYERNNNDI
tara:strand:- start:655 stop:783 length:129 start_codon:yes stop_codon:yes gene_type:complete